MRVIAQAILKRPGVILLVVLGFVGPTLVFTLLQPTVYEASAIAGLELKQDWGLRWEPSEAASEVMEAIDKSAIAEEGIRRLGLRMSPDELLENLTIEEIENTQLIPLSYRDTNPQRAQRISNAVAKVASEKISQKAPFVYHLQIHVAERASVPGSPVSPTPVRTVAMALWGLWLA